LIETLESDIEDLLLRAEGETSLDRARLLRAIAEVMDRHREVIGIVPKHMPGAASDCASRGENHQRRLLKLLAGPEPTSESILRARSAVKVLMLEIIPRPVDQSGAKSNADIEILLKIAADTLGI
jgi:hypothetical protein